MEELRFCPACGGELARRRPDGDEHERLVCTVCGRIHYQNPVLVVGSVCLDGGRVLLCRRAISPQKGLWTIPAGFLELGESPEEGAAREAFEEARARIRILGLLAVYSVRRIGQVQLIYLSGLAEPEIAPGPESLEVALFDWQHIPWNSLAFPTVHWALRRAMALRRSDGPLVPESNPEGRDPEPLSPGAGGTA